jgi:hypothetical protein
MKRRFIVSMGAVLLPALLVGHGSAVYAGKKTAADFFPMSASAGWVYQEVCAGQVVATETWRVRSGNNGIYRIEVQTLRRDSLAKRDAKGQRVAAISEEYVIVDAAGVARTQGLGAPEQSDYVIRNPIAVGTAWGDERNRCRITSIDMTDDLSGSTYRGCVEVTCETGRPAQVQVVSHFARGIGLVSQQVKATMDMLGEGAVGTHVDGLEEGSGKVESLLVLQAAH